MSTRTPETVIDIESDDLGLKLYDHQREMMALMTDNPERIIRIPAGLGRTSYKKALAEAFRPPSDAAEEPPGTQRPAAASPALGAPYGKLMKKARAIHGWPNWFINRGIVSNPPTKKELRALSWRRKK